jgi:hypothetical protein
MAFAYRARRKRERLFPLSAVPALDHPKRFGPGVPR